MPRLNLLVACVCPLSLVGAVACAAPRAEFEASLTSIDGGLALAWHDSGSDSAQIYFQFTDAGGRPTGVRHQATQGAVSAYEPSIAGQGDQLVIAWYEKDAASTMTVKLGAWDRQGRSLWLRTLSGSASNGRNPVARVHGERILCAWLQQSLDSAPTVWAQWFDNTGAPLSAAIEVAPAGTTTWNLNAAIDAHGVAWIAFDAQVGTRADELFVAQVSADTAITLQISVDDGFASKYPDIDIAAERVALTWFDERDGNQEVYLYAGAPEWSAVESRARRVTNTPGNSIGAYLKWNGARVGLAWCDDSAGQHEIYFQSFDASALSRHASRRLTQTKTQSLIPAIERWRDGFALAWNEFDTADERRDRARSISRVKLQLVR